MFIFVIDRVQNIHIVSYEIGGHRFRTFCGKLFSKNKRLNTFAAHSGFNGACHICNKIFEESYLSNLNNSLAYACGPTQDMMLSKFMVFGARDDNFSSSLVNRRYSKLSKIKYAMNRNSKYYGK